MSNKKNFLSPPLKSPNEGVKIALQKYGKDAKIVAIPEGPYVLAQTKLIDKLYQNE